MDYTVKDSSLWQMPEAKARINYKDNTIRAGIVRQEIFDKRKDEEETKYIVDVIEPGGGYSVVCRRMVNFGGPFNYEEYTRQTYNEKTDGSGKGAFRTRPGDHVLMVYISGDDKEGVIIGSLRHPSRKERLSPDNKVAYASEFNGLETTISNDGAWQIRFRGQPTNVDILNQPPVTGDVIVPEYDDEIGNSFLGIDVTGSWVISDAAIEKEQLIKISKNEGTISIISGDIVLHLDKNSEEYSITTKKTTFNAVDEFAVDTKKFAVTSQNIEITADDIKTKGKIKHTGEVESKGAFKIKGETKVDGAFTTTGETALAGGGLPAIQQILLIIGTGNLGIPVISAPTVLTSQLTTMA